MRSSASVDIHARVAFLPGIRVTLKALKPNIFAEPPRTLGEHIKARRLALLLTQKDLARRLGVSSFTVLNWERGKTAPSPQLSDALAHFLGRD